jgi:hypothetical protein
MLVMLKLCGSLAETLMIIAFRVCLNLKPDTGEDAVMLK